MSESKFKVGSFWKSRKGDKYRVVANDMPGDYPIAAHVLVSSVIHMFNKEGHFGNNDTQSIHDLITECSEPSRLLAWVRFLNGAPQALIWRLEGVMPEGENWQRRPGLDEREE